MGCVISTTDANNPTKPRPIWIDRRPKDNQNHPMRFSAIFTAIAMFSPLAELVSQELSLQVIHEPPIFQAVAYEQVPETQQALLTDPESVNAKAPAGLALPESAPRNLRVLAKFDTSLTPLHIAGALGNLELTRLLLDAGADRWAQTKKYKNTPVELALENKMMDTARLLMRAPVDAVDYRIEVSLANQSLQVLHNGRTILQAPISSGKKSKPSERGEFLIAQKSKNHRSNLYNNARMPWFCRFSWTAGGLHQGNLPGYPASHGCIRTTREAAKFVFETCPMGTLVVVD